MRTLAGLAFAWALTAVASGAQAQDMLSATIQSNIDFTTNQRMIDDTRQHDRDVYLRRHRSGSAGGTANSMTLTQNAVMGVLAPEYRRRVPTYGKPPADQWLISASRSVGQQVGALKPEYLSRVKSHGRARADAWYAAQTRSIGRQVVARQ